MLDYCDEEITNPKIVRLNYVSTVNLYLLQIYKPMYNKK